MTSRWRSWLVFNIVLGTTVMVGINNIAPVYIKDLTTIIHDRRGDESSLLSPLMDFLAFIAQFFEDCLTHPLGRSVSFMFVSIYVPTLFLMAVEANRAGTSGLIAWYSFFTLVLQVLGVGPVFPLMWIPAYMAHQHYSASAKGTNALALSSRKTWVIGAALWLQLLTVLGSTLFSAPQFRSAAAIANIFVPASVALIWTVVPTQISLKSDGSTTGIKTIGAAADGASAAVAHYNIAAGIGLCLWTLTIIELINQRGTLLGTLSQWVQQPGLNPGTAANAVLSVDGVGLWVALLGFAAAEDGFAVMMKVAAGSMLVGPGAAIAMYLGNVRERRIGNTVIVSLRKVE